MVAGAIVGEWLTTASRAGSTRVVFNGLVAWMTRRGRKVESFRVTELPDGQKEPVLRAYLKRWKAEVGVFFDGVPASSPEDEVERIAPRHPVFRIKA